MDEITNISMIVLAVALALPIISQLLLHRPRLLTACKYIVIGVYALAYLSETLLFREITPEAKYELSLFWSYRASIQIPGGLSAVVQALFSDGFPAALSLIRLSDPSLLKEIILNILLFIPMGYMLPFTWPKLVKRHHLPWKVVFIGFGVSLLTELMQLVFHLGLFEFDDIFNNTLGCIIGALIYKLVIHKRASRVHEHQAL